MAAGRQSIEDVRRNSEQISETAAGRHTELGTGEGCQRRVGRSRASNFFVLVENYRTPHDLGQDIQDGKAQHLWHTQ